MIATTSCQVDSATETGTQRPVALPPGVPPRSSEVPPAGAIRSTTSRRHVFPRSALFHRVAAGAATRDVPSITFIRPRNVLVCATTRTVRPFSISWRMLCSQRGSAARSAETRGGGEAGGHRRGRRRPRRGRGGEGKRVRPRGECHDATHTSAREGKARTNEQELEQARAKCLRNCGWNTARELGSTPFRSRPSSSGRSRSH